jgi:hypothetical protein
MIIAQTLKTSGLGKMHLSLETNFLHDQFPNRPTPLLSSKTTDRHDRGMTD